MKLENPIDLAIAPEVFFTVWLNLWRNREVTTNDVAYAATELFATDKISIDRALVPWQEWLTSLASAPHPYLLAWPTTGDPAGLPIAITQPTIAINDREVLVSSRIHHDRPHRIHNEALKFALSRQSTKVAQVLDLAQSELTSGDREVMEALLAQVSTATLPLQTPGNLRKTLETSSTLRAIGLLALAHVEVVSSRSKNELLQQQLSELVRACELAICATVSNI